MEKISREELMKKLNLSDEDLDKVTGGSNTRSDCLYNCLVEKGDPMTCIKHCSI